MSSCVDLQCQRLTKSQIHITIFEMEGAERVSPKGDHELRDMAAVDRNDDDLQAATQDSEFGKSTNTQNEIEEGIGANEQEQALVPDTTSEDMSTTTTTASRTSSHFLLQAGEPGLTNDFHHFAGRSDDSIILRSPSNVSLSLTVSFVDAKDNPLSILESSTICADKCEELNSLRSQVFSTVLDKGNDSERALADSDLLQNITNLKVVSFRLEEDGNVASMNITPTRINESCPMPYKIYESWHYRNVLRGKLKEYRVDVRVCLS
jgi:hypothetical protein